MHTNQFSLFRLTPFPSQLNRSKLIEIPQGRGGGDSKAIAERRFYKNLVPNYLFHLVIIIDKLLALIGFQTYSMFTKGQEKGFRINNTKIEGKTQKYLPMSTNLCEQLAQTSNHS